MYTITKGTEFDRTRCLLLLRKSLTLRLLESTHCILQKAGPTDPQPEAIFADVLGHLFMAYYEKENVEWRLFRWRQAIAQGQDNLAGVAAVLGIPKELAEELGYLHRRTTLRVRDIIYLLEGKPLTSLDPLKRTSEPFLYPERPVA